MDRERIVKFLMEFAHYEDAATFVDEFPKLAFDLARGIYHAVLNDTAISLEFRKVVEEKWSSILNG